MKPWMRWGLGIAIAILMWAALDDITTGSEPDYTTEYAIVFVGTLYFLILIGFWIRKRRQKQPI